MTTFTPGLGSALSQEQKEIERLREEVAALRSKLAATEHAYRAVTPLDLVRLSNSDPFRFLPAGGETGVLIRALNWERHSLGQPQTWSPVLKVTLATILGSRHPMFLFWGPDALCFYNDAYLPSFGQGKHPAAMGQPGQQCWPEIWSIIGPQIEDVMERGVPSWHVDHLVPILRNGKVEEVYWTYGYSPVRETDGAIVGTLVICTETTNAVHSRAELAAEREKLQSIFAQAPVGICVTEGPEHVYSLVNPFALSMISPSNEREMVGKTVSKAQPELEGQGFNELLDRVYQTGEAFTGRALPFEVVQADGSNKKLYLDFVYVAKRNADGAIDGILCVFTDVTERQLAIEQLETEQQLREQFVAALTHDLRTPLTAAKMSAQLMMRNADEKTLKLASRISHNMDRAELMIRDLLDASRIKAGERVPLKIEACDLNSVLHGTVEDLAAAYGDRLVFKSSGQVLGWWDRLAVQRCVENLAINAVKYGSTSAPVSISVDQDGDFVLISVHNDGIALSSQEINGFFKPFKRAESAMRSGQKGWGIGLTLVKGFAEAHGGSVEARSEEGQGTTFTMRLPLDTRQTHA
ncbi:MAG: PAS domain-containing protein [Methylotenera sp.]|nr:PAS domain-containing protein [Oligoflexia bacterium]